MRLCYMHNFLGCIGERLTCCWGIIRYQKNHVLYTSNLKSKMTQKCRLGKKELRIRDPLNTKIRDFWCVSKHEWINRYLATPVCSRFFPCGTRVNTFSFYWINVSNSNSVQNERHQTKRPMDFVGLNGCWFICDKESIRLEFVDIDRLSPCSCKKY